MDDTKPDIVVSTDESTYILPPQDEEELRITNPNGRPIVWALKIPKELLERWEMVEEAGVELGTLVIDSSVKPARITLRLADPAAMENTKPSPISTDADDPMTSASSSSRPGPSKRPRYDISGIPDEYTVHMPVDHIKNTYVFTEKKRVYGARNGEAAVERDGYGKRKRDKVYPTLIAPVNHECHSQPVQNEKYFKILEQRRLESEQSKRPVMRMEDAGLSQAEQNQLASGYRNATSTFGSKMIVSDKPNPGERFARLERHELIDRIFACFREKPYWGIPALKTTLKQPDSWLREVLRDVAVQIKEGQYMNMWELKRGWKEGGGGGGEQAEGGGEGEGDQKPDLEALRDQNDDEDEDDDEDDFEEVM
ncbi:hypothetical protein CI109_104398 [Kwoniella shandongensis]|uniref:Transcription initiation factor IIF subunit beta n=1 Tax=Kwoniella shandongensis TaxID=1734106 RepID=A0A5M6BYT1_9TREE|nr:uncharacterized protein CI109_004203 [Kwoniella shandongensis]KAA5527390.1 hypothetical protein CI109_004203 [Kwoniella shandongensis]